MCVFETHRERPSLVHSPQMSTSSQDCAKAGSWELSPGLPQGWQRPNYSTQHLCLPCISRQLELRSDGGDIQALQHGTGVSKPLIQTPTPNEYMLRVYYIKSLNYVLVHFTFQLFLELGYYLFFK